jgi:branched-chain amino acid transport system ATP-binding protein
MSDYLVVEHVTAGYAATTILDDVSLRLGEHESCAVLGRNGVGKTTLLATIMGHTELHRGSIRLAGRELARLPIHRRARAGIGFVPQEREIFRSLTVEENLTVAMRRGAWPIERIYGFFPRLAERRRNRGSQLSGGEQQMLSIGRALMGGPKLVLMDEPLEGLAPVIVDALLAAMWNLREEAGLAILLVEQHARRALEFAQSVIVLDRGKVVYDGPSAELRNDHERLAALVGVGGERRRDGRRG